MRPAVLAVLALAVACNRSGDQATGFSTSITTAPHGSTSEAADESSTSSSSAEDSAAASSASSTSSGSSTAATITDVGNPPDGGSGPPPGCKGKVDIVFTISSDELMLNQQQQLKTSFPGFVATLEQQFADFDYHILSVNTAGPWVLPWCAGCKDICPQTPDYPCNAVLEPCDSVHGAGVTFPRGDNASNKRCELASGRRYITAPQPELLDAFTCIASVGTDGADLVAEATVKALSNDLNAPGGCNEGFLRDDALLVVVAIQDTYDGFSDGTPQDWANALLDAKHGDGNAVVLLVISTDVDDPDSLCGYDPGSEHELRTWTKLVPHGLFGSICAPSYAPFFAEAAAMIKTQCDVFVPQ